MPSSSRQEERCCSSELTTALLPFCILWPDPAYPVCTAITRIDAIDRRKFGMSRACPQSQWMTGTVLIISYQIRLNQIRFPKIALDQSCTRRRRRKLRSSGVVTTHHLFFLFHDTFLLRASNHLTRKPARQPARRRSTARLPLTRTHLGCDDTIWTLCIAEEAPVSHSPPPRASCVHRQSRRDMENDYLYVGVWKGKRIRGP